MVYLARKQEGRDAGLFETLQNRREGRESVAHLVVAKGDIHRSNKAAPKDASFQPPGSAIKAIDGIAQIRCHIQVPVWPKLDHFRAVTVGSKCPHRLTRPGIEFYDCVIEKAGNVNVAIRPEIKPPGPVEEPPLVHPAHHGAVSGAESQDLVVVMTADKHRVATPTDRLSAARFSGELIDKSAGRAVIAKDPARIAADHVEIAVWTEAQAHRGYESAAPRC